MADSSYIAYLREFFEGIRDERRTSANTATRIGTAFLELLGMLETMLGIYLSRVDDDTAEGFITFLKGLKSKNITFTEFLKSEGASKGFLDGMGIYMDALEGLIQTDGLEVRGFMRVMELIINRLQLMESDYSFTEGADVEHIDYTDDGRLKLTIHKEHDNDYVPFYQGDILYAKVNNLLPRGAAVPTGHTSTKNGSYYTVWMMCDEVDYADNTITVSLYQSKEPDGDPIVPGGRNFTPYGSPIIDTDSPSSVLAAERFISAETALANNVVLAVAGNMLGNGGFDTHLTLTRHGNIADSTDPSIKRSQQGRQQSWVLSTTDQRLTYYWHVDSPFLRSDNIALCLGILPTVLDDDGILPSTRDKSMPSLYINTVFYENIHHIYYPSRIVKEDRGEWVVPDSSVPQPEVTYTGPTGTFTPDGTLLTIQEEVDMGNITAARAAAAAIVNTWGGSYSTGQRLMEPYHFESMTKVEWLTQRLSPAWKHLSDRELYMKIIIEWHHDLETSRVWYYGALWECRADGNTSAPWFNNADWQCIRTSDISLKIAISKRFLRLSDFTGNQVATTLAFVLTVGQTDITSQVDQNDVEWTRQTVGADTDAALAAADRAWNQNYGYHRLQIPIRSGDLPSNFWTVREVQFTCTVNIDGISAPVQRTITLH